MARTSRPMVAGLLAALVVAAGCTVPVFAPAADDTGAAGPVATGGPTPPELGSARWRPCPEVPAQMVGRPAPGFTYECASVAVPRDWTAPAGQQYEIALLRARAEGQTGRLGSLLVNPGGPGASGIETAVALSFGPRFGGLPIEVTRRFDVIGFDPRGVGRSSTVDCISDADLDATFGAEPDPDTKAEFDQIVRLHQRVATLCGAKYGDQLPLFSTEQAARDMDAVRAAVGDPKLTYLGFSYGTLLGATYAQLFPDKVRALVLDGAVDPRKNFVAGAEGQVQGFERAFANFTAWCARTAARCPIAPDARKAVTDAIDKARTAPVAGPRGRRATAGWVLFGVLSALYTQQGWEELGRAIAALGRGDATGVFKLADAYARRDSSGRYTNMFDANLAVNCADADDEPTVAQVRALQSQWRTKYPLFGAALAVQMLPCVYWPGKPDPYPTGAAAGAPPILVVGTTGDPATPYEQTAALAQMLGVGRVLTWDGEGHTAYPDTPCITRAVNAYLIDLTVPREGLRCPPR